MENVNHTERWMHLRVYVHRPVFHAAMKLSSRQLTFQYLIIRDERQSSAVGTFYFLHMSQSHNSARVLTVQEIRLRIGSNILSIQVQ